MALKVVGRDGGGFSVVAYDDETGDWLLSVDVHESDEVPPVGMMVDVYEAMGSTPDGAFELLSEETYWYDDFRQDTED